MPKQKDTDISGSQEDYLEAILELTRESGAARVRDLALRMNVAKSSVTVALRHLAKTGLVNYEPYQLVSLTVKGRRLSESISDRHRTLRELLIGILGVKESVADAHACRMEHAIDDSVMTRINCFVAFMRKSDVSARHLPEAFKTYCDQEIKSGKCRSAQITC